MKKNKTHSAFTLIELMVIIAIIWIMAWLGSQINLNKISDKNKLIIFNNSIVSQFETFRNNILLWKWVDSNVWVKESWKMTYNTTNSWTITPSYLSWTWITYPDSSINTEDFYSITDINCLDINKTLLNSGTNAEVFIQGNNFSLSGACTWASRILEFTTKFRANTSKIYINTLNWLIEIQ